MRLGFWGNFGTHNLGNECTLHSILVNARRYLPGADLVGIGNDTRDITERHNIEALSISAPGSAADADSSGPLARLRRMGQEPADWLRVWRAMRNIDMLLIAGTGIITDNNEGLLGAPYQMFKWVVAARLAGQKVKFVSVGAEKLSQPIPRFFLRWALRLANYRSYRDEVSRNRVFQLAGAKAHDRVRPDLAFSLPQPVIARAAIPTTRGQTVAVGVYAVESSPESTDAYVAAIGTFILWLLEHGYHVRIVIGDAAYDPPIEARIRDWLAEKGALDRVKDEPATSFEDLFDQLRDADLVVATRFHNIQFSLMLDKPVVSLSHMDKNDELMAAMGLSDYCRTLEGIDADQIVRLFQKLQANASTLSLSIRDRRALFRAQLEEQYQEVFESTLQTNEA